MSSTFLILRYIAFALFITLHSTVCIVAAFNLGSLTADAPGSLAQIDTFLIVLGALGIMTIFPVIFVELVRKHAFIARVSSEIAWVGLLWLMNLSGAAGLTAIAPVLNCFATKSPHGGKCTTIRILLAFIWLSTITLLSYLLVLLICAVHHSQEDADVWRSGVRDYPWFPRQQSLEDQPDKSSYGKLVDPKELSSGRSAIYARQVGLPPTFTVEPLKVRTTIERPAPVAARRSRSNRAPLDTYRFPRPSVPTQSTPASSSYSLYPQHIQGTQHPMAIPPGRGEPTPPPAGVWPRSNPQEPLRRKRTLPGATPRAPDLYSFIPSDPAGPAPELGPSHPEMAEREPQLDGSLSSAARSRPSGPRTLLSSRPGRPKPSPLDLSFQKNQSGPPDR